jgi:beta-lactamase regulating signal transducer with metallopeptidase domain
MKSLVNWVKGHAHSVSLAVATVGGTMVALAQNAGATAQYDLSPVTTSITSELTANIPVILGIVGGLIALTLGMKFLRRFAK